MLVAVKRYVEQVIDGKKYKGYVQIADVKFDYRFTFAVGVPRLEEMKLTADDMLRVFIITLNKGGIVTKLSGEDHAFFLSILLEFILRFYENSQTRDAQNGIVLFGWSRMSRHVHAKSLIGMEEEKSYDFSPQLCERIVGMSGCSR